MALNRTTDAATEPISRDEAKDHLHVTHAAEDTWIDSAIVAARMAAEEFMAASLISQTWTRELDDWPASGVIELRRGPVISVSSVKYYDTDGTLTTLVSGTDYQVDVSSRPARIALEPDMTWPSVETGRLNAVEVIYVAGYGTGLSDVPQLIRSGILLVIGSLHEHREDETDVRITEIPRTARNLWWPFRQMSA